jgi:cytochrome P450
VHVVPDGRRLDAVQRTIDALLRGDHADQHQAYRAIRDHDPVCYADAMGMWVVTGRAECEQALLDAGSFAWRPPLASDRDAPPASSAAITELQRRRSEYYKRFAAVARAGGAAQYRASAERAFDRFRALPDEPREAVLGLCEPYAREVVGCLLGVGGERWDELYLRRRREIRPDSGVARTPIGPVADGLRAALLDRSEREAREVVAARLEHADPPHGLAARWATATLTERARDELAGVILSVAVNAALSLTDLTAAVLRRGLGMQHRDTSGARTASTAALVEETMRIDAPVQAVQRWTTRTARLGDHDIPAGARVVLVLAAADRDPRAFPQPDDFRPRRTQDRPALGFGAGRDHCRGANAAREMAAILYDTVVLRAPRARLAEGNTFPCWPGISNRGLSRLWIEGIAAGGSPC